MMLIVICFSSELEYRLGTITNYSMGIAAYTCFATAGIYLLLTVYLLLHRGKYIEHHKRTSMVVYTMVLTGCMVYQMIEPEVLLTSIGCTIIIVGIYINNENPDISELSRYHHEMVTGFATLVENRDDNTGGHIRRTSLYVELLAKELRKRDYYSDVLTKDYIQNLQMAAPMHDIGKISVPDAVLQKPGKLTDEEYAIMKKHTRKGGNIIKETFGNLENREYRDMAYDVAVYHHEKWNGKGYPEGLKETEIPLSARIMAIADVFDALSEKRCYREAMPLDQCFSIIEEGRGRDFEPVLVDVFLSVRDKVEQLHDSVV